MMKRSRLTPQAAYSTFLTKQQVEQTTMEVPCLAGFPVAHYSVAQLLPSSSSPQQLQALQVQFSPREVSLERPLQVVSEPFPLARAREARACLVLKHLCSQEPTLCSVVLALRGSRKKEKRMMKMMARVPTSRVTAHPLSKLMRTLFQELPTRRSSSRSSHAHPRRVHTLRSSL